MQFFYNLLNEPGVMFVGGHHLHIVCVHSPSDDPRAHVAFLPAAEIYRTASGHPAC